MEKQQISIHIGEFYASNEPAIIDTVLGSCVAVCLFDPVKRIGGMNHILLPGKADLKRFDASARYGINAMELLINKVMGLGSRRSRLVAKAFGGANMFQSISAESGVGEKNSEFVIEFLNNEDIKIISKDLGGHDTRRIFFHTDTGDVFLKRTHSKRDANIAIEQQKRLKYIRKEIKKSGEVTLFE